MSIFSHPEKILTVSRLNALLKETVEDNFVQVWVEGEISNFTPASSGHWYFSLKDENAQIRCIMFRAQARALVFRPENGTRVLCCGRISLYTQRGDLQLIVETMETRGLGNLQLAFEQLKQKLMAEGLFDTHRKRSLPAFPQVIGVVTSATGAAIHDIITVLQRRSVGLRVLLRPVRVQGEEAAGEIAEAIADLNRQGEVDVLIVGRGGGSLEDLWAFNEERVARAIHASQIPVISAVGHEVDVTIADFVADLRAPTPSAAAELVVKNRQELEGHVDHLILRLASPMSNQLHLLKERLEGLTRRLRSPAQSLAIRKQHQENLSLRLTKAMAQKLEKSESYFVSTVARLDTLSPLKTLTRGYAIAFREETGDIVRQARELTPGDHLNIRFGQGSAEVQVKKVSP
ncbi:exodeoxyribonuclease VII large subunit [Desulfuromonas sp. AOP6]|uniref:exodeoxyribonuclease VII large subunit n=1 Tax=Desulfuromonas sp. AOP6 TaxID=1566351 RepID=UPI001288616A|nr:exodeoxyribonuclease VII large subunit [Desulfuromonas sp. AOP6]BCA79377.1 exodeoxyribonuclease 7 large subunit [Desulfuromonas sp. AOP6]